MNVKEANDIVIEESEAALTSDTEKIDPKGRQTFN